MFMLQVPPKHVPPVTQIPGQRQTATYRYDALLCSLTGYTESLDQFIEAVIKDEQYLWAIGNELFDHKRIVRLG